MTSSKLTYNFQLIHMNAWYGFFLFFSMFAVADLSAQCEDLTRSEREEKVMGTLSQLQDGGYLIVQIAGYHKQIAELDRLIEEGKLSSEALQGVKERREEYIVIRQNRLRYLTRAFDRFYEYSKVAFTYHHYSDQMNDGTAEIWLDSLGHASSSDEITQKRALCLVEGRTKGNSIEAFQLQNVDDSDICSPLPTYFRMNRLSTLFLVGEKAEIKKCENLAMEMNAIFGQIKPKD